MNFDINLITAKIAEHHENCLKNKPSKTKTRQNKSLELIRGLLEKYSNIEEEYRRMYTISNPILYYYNTECDSNQTEFEYIANNRQICVESCLSPCYVKQIMLIFQAIYDNNMFLFDPESLDDFPTDCFDMLKWFELASESKNKLIKIKNGEHNGNMSFANMVVQEKHDIFTFVFNVYDLLSLLNALYFK